MQKRHKGDKWAAIKRHELCFISDRKNLKEKRLERNKSYERY
jgi:hypothetical protein